MNQLNRKIVFAIIGGLFFAFVTFNVSAVPTLQLDIIGGEYDGITETIYGDGDLVAYGKKGYDGDDSSQYSVNEINLLEGYDYEVSIAIMSLDGTTITASTDVGSFVFGGTTYSVANGNLTYGTPPVDDDLASHGIFETIYGTYDFEWNPSRTRDFVNTQDTPGSDPTDSGNTGDDLYYRTFSWDLSGLNDNFGLHFDLYELNGDGDVVTKAPFSHDAMSTVPEPAPIAILGLGMLAVFLNSRRKRT